jgi:hypothetical protein
MAQVMSLFYWQQGRAQGLSASASVMPEEHAFSTSAAAKQGNIESVKN